MLGLLKNTGPNGPNGPNPSKPLISNANDGTTKMQPMGPVDSDWSQHAPATGPNIIAGKQAVSGHGTNGTNGTTVFEQARAPDFGDLYPAQWYAILEGLKAREPVEWLSAERWQLLISDAEKFLPRWGSAAHSLGWSALDLFGVHPLAPAARFDVMGLLPMLHGAAILTLTDSAATLRQRSGSTSTYRRPTQAGAVLVSDVNP